MQIMCYHFVVETENPQSYRIKIRTWTILRNKFTVLNAIPNAKFIYLIIIYFFSWEFLQHGNIFICNVAIKCIYSASFLYHLKENVLQLFLPFIAFLTILQFLCLQKYTVLKIFCKNKIGVLFHISWIYDTLVYSCHKSRNFLIGRT